MPLPQFISLGRTISTQDLAEINTIQLKGTSTLIRGVSYVILEEDFLRQTVRRYLRWDMGKSDPMI
jgi:hypothetical protein